MTYVQAYFYLVWLALNFLEYYTSVGPIDI